LTLFMSAQDLGSEGDFAKALAVLDRLESLLNAGPAPGETPPGKKPDGVPSSNVDLQQSILDWDAARKKTHADLQALERAILELFADDARLADVKAKARKLDNVLGEYADELRDRLDDAYNAPAEDKADYCAVAAAALKRYRAYLTTDPFIKAVSKNLLMPINIEGVLGKTLDSVAKKLGA
jgi:hypothetical protein